MYRRSLSSPIAGALMTLGIAFVTAAQAPGGLPRVGDEPPGGLTPPHAVLSPPSKTSLSLAGGKILVAYGAPSMRKRVIFGELVPFHAVWRAGANDATALHTDFDLHLNGLDIPKGDYTLFVWVEPKQWQLIVNRQTGQSGLDYDSKRDLGRVAMQLSTLAKPVERFRITLSRAGKSDGGCLELAWEKTVASVDFTVRPK